MTPSPSTTITARGDLDGVAGEPVLTVCVDLRGGYRLGFLGDGIAFEQVAHFPTEQAAWAAYREAQRLSVLTSGV